LEIRSERANISFVPHPSKIDKFLTCVQASGLLSIDELKIACGEFGQGNQTELCDSDLFVLCNYLVISNRLTVWQCMKLLNGQYKGFYLDHYKILDDIGIADKILYYLAEDTETKRQVRLRITPPSLVPLKEGKPHYRVEEL
jgi:hypothetical protein